VCRSRFNHTYITKLLLDHGADVHHKDSAGKTALHYAVMINRDSGFGPRGNASATMLIHHGAEVNAVSTLGTPPIHLAAFCDNWQAIGLLVSHGADINAVSNAGNTAAMVALEQNVGNSHSAVIDDLYMYGAQAPPPEDGAN
jgi:ankyrin repeat protein